ncbi:hypothetical protein FRC06_003687 [Ceratobasidium sp. 370]|nr:hypothetical protein FRC06_003687 [Ceratobasidium sp. 370]
MCESTSEMIETFFKQDGITRDDPLFANIPVNKWSKPWKKHSAMRGEQEPDQINHHIPTGPRYKPYSLDDRPDTSTSAQASHSVTFPPKKEPLSPESPSKFSALRRASFGSSTSSKFVPNKNWSNLAKSPSLAAKQAASPPSPVSLPPPLPSPSPSSLDDIDQRQLNLKLQSDIQKLVSDHIDTVHEVLELETKNENLQNKLEAAEQELAQLRDSLKAAETREQALATQLSEAESERDGAQDACTQALAGIQGLLANQQVAEAAKLQVEAELQQLRERFGAVEAQLALAEAQLKLSSKHTAEVGVQSESFGADAEASDASSVDLDDACTTPIPTTDHDQYLAAKPDQHDFLGFLDAFHDIDNLVKGAFGGSGSSFMAT